ncbi:hypothetical protein SAMN05216391_10932 [Lachnospiraceae bacterium KHCPX20]|nr:hypothetical protein SAMN05216391_10932 [Lachnospiraceae bacterium KHCPX20]
MYKEGYWKRRSEILKNNMIKVSKSVVMDEEKIFEHYKNEADFVPFLSLIPPYESGLLRFEFSNTSACVSWVIKELDIDNSNIVLDIEIYSFLPGARDSKVWTQCVKGIFTLRDNNGALECNFERRIIEKEAYPFFQNWIKTSNDKEILSFANKYMLNEDDCLKTLGNLFCLPFLHNEQKQPVHCYKDYLDMEVLNFTQLVINIFSNINAYLYYASKRNKEGCNTNISEVKMRSIQKGGSTDPSDKRITRIVNGITFLSKIKPKHPTYKGLRHFTCASWSVRGHVRTYKSGKTVYVRPHEKHRKSLTEQETKKARLVIK